MTSVGSAVQAAPMIRDIDLPTLRRAFGHHPSGLVAVVAEVDGEPVSLLASSFTVGVSAEPPLVSIAVQTTSTSWPLLRRARSLGISSLADDQSSLARGLAGSDRAARLAGVDLVAAGSDARFVAGAASWYECTLYDELQAGDHTLALLQVTALRIDDQREPLIFHDSAFRTLRP